MRCGGTRVKRAWKQKSIQAVSCLFCLIMWRYGPKLDGTEFSGGWLTGPLLTLYNSGTLLYGTALLLTFIFRRISAAITIVASLLCLLLYAYFVAPGHFRWFLEELNSRCQVERTSSGTI